MTQKARDSLVAATIAFTMKVEESITVTAKRMQA